VDGPQCALRALVGATLTEGARTMGYEHDEQMAFRDLLEQMEATELAAIDEYRSFVQRWFDTLPEGHKRELGEWMH